MIRRVLAALTLILLPLQAMALDFVTATPSTAYVQGTGAALVTVRWTLQITVASDQTVTVSSSGGTLTAGAAPPVSAGGTLRRTVRLAAGTHQVRIVERLRIDRTSARRILEGGSGIFVRVFTDTLPSSATATVSLQARPTGSGGLSLQNIDLSFDDGASFRTVETGEALTARVSVTTTGRGVITGKWEIAGPDGGFRPLARVRLTAGGPTRAERDSPPLPTDALGSYRLRFIVDGDGEGSGDPVIRYTVTSGTGLAVIALTAPAEGAVLASQTRFRWQPVNGAARYRIDFLNEGDTQPLASVETADAAASVRSFTLARLVLGSSLVWRVLALDGSGAVIARSSQRRIGAP